MRHQENPYIVPLCHQSLDILYQDEELLVVNKPEMLLSTPGKHPLNRDSVISRIQQQHPEAKLVHRLDLATSGIMIIALNKFTHVGLSQQFQLRQISKHYTALLYGSIAEDTGTIDLPIICDWERRPLQKICHQHGKPSLTHFEVQERAHSGSGSFTRVRFMPVTGRSHQLRIHSREIGHPILGCDMYAHDNAYAMADRLMLHASHIGFRHPKTDAVVNIDCPAPF